MLRYKWYVRYKVMNEDKQWVKVETHVPSKEIAQMTIDGLLKNFSIKDAEIVGKPDE